MAGAATEPMAVGWGCARGWQVGACWLPAALVAAPCWGVMPGLAVVSVALVTGLVVAGVVVAGLVVMGLVVTGLVVAGVAVVRVVVTRLLVVGR